MRIIYLIRHGRVGFPNGIKRCIGRTDLLLDDWGKRQAEDLREYFRLHPVKHIYCSQLTRSIETARILGGWKTDGRDGSRIPDENGADRMAIPVRIDQDLQELDMGEWENVPMADLDKTLEQEPVKGERRTEAKFRMERAVTRILKETDGDVAVVAHAGINCCFLAGITGSPLETSRALFQPYGGISRIAVRELENGSFNYQLLELGRMPRLYPTDEECAAMLEHYRTPEPVRKHCCKVASIAEVLGKVQEQMGVSLDQGLIRSASLLHDIARHRENHAREGTRILMREGYPAVAEIIRQHHCLEQEEINEAAIVYLADKLVKGDRTVTLEERFRDTEQKCRASHEAWNNHEMRREQAFRILRMMGAGMDR